MHRINKANFTAWALSIRFGLGFGIMALALKMGATQRKGPGYFPMVLAVLLIGIGIAIVASACRTAGEAIGTYDWLRMVVFLAASVFFLA